jgi:hypothetical protein
MRAPGVPHRFPTVAAATLLVLAVVSCGDDGPASAPAETPASDVPGPTTGPTATIGVTATDVTAATDPVADLPRVYLRIDTDQVAFVIDHDGSLSVSEMRDPSRDPGCGTTTAFFSGTLDLRIEAVPTDCALAGPIDPGDGEHGRYRTIDDVADPIDVEDVDTALGPAVLFAQHYDDAEEALAIVTLDDPVDPNYPTLVIRSDDGDFGRDELRAMLATLDPPGDLFDPDHAAMGT